MSICVRSAVLRIGSALALAISAFAAGGTPASAQEAAGVAEAPPPLPWAYPVSPPRGSGAPAAAARPAQDADAAQAVPGSARSYTRAQLRNGFDVADWRPDLHPEMPEVVSHGREPDVRGCGFCHYPNGQGRPENSAVAGLPAAYIIQQMADFKEGRRRSAEPRMGPQRAMIALAENANDEEVRVAAEYFASFEFRPWIRVVETNTVPRTAVAGGMHVPAEGGGVEPIGQRIIETPEDPDRTALRDPASGFVAYVPVGSIERGQELVATGAGRTIQCGICHGSDLKGLGPIPAIAGRSPSYLARQLYDFQSGARRGAWSGLMAEAVESLTPDDILAIVAYAASLEP